MRRFALSLILSLILTSAALADCKADFSMQNYLAEKLNTMTKDSDCAETVSLSALFQIFQQEHLEVTKRLKAECNSIDGNSIEELENWIKNHGAAEKACKQTKMFKSAAEEPDEAGKAAERAAAERSEDYAAYKHKMLANLEAIEQAEAEKTAMGYLLAAALLRKQIHK